MRKVALVAAAGWIAWRVSSQIWPYAYPYSGRAILDLPRPLITRAKLLEILAPTAGERMLEIGPGTGYYSLPVAAELGPGGSLELLDVRPEFLDHTVKRATALGVENIATTVGDGGSLPYPDSTFDGAFLITVLGELPDPDAGLRELRRVLKPEGRLVVGEIIIDPDFPRLGWLTKRAEAAGFSFERRSGGMLGYFARFSCRRNRQ